MWLSFQFLWLKIYKKKNTKIADNVMIFYLTQVTESRETTNGACVFLVKN